MRHRRSCADGVDRGCCSCCSSNSGVKPLLGYKCPGVVASCYWMWLARNPLSPVLKYHIPFTVWLQGMKLGMLDIVTVLDMQQWLVHLLDRTTLRAMVNEIRNYDC